MSFFNIIYFIDNSIKNILHSNLQICSVYEHDNISCREYHTFLLQHELFVHSNPKYKKKQTWKNKLEHILYIISS